MCAEQLSLARRVAEELASLGDALGHEVRSVILLRLICGPARWSGLRSFLSKLYGYNINPNVLAFHLRRLVERGIVERRDIGGEPIYVLSDKGIVEPLMSLLRSIDIDPEDLCKGVKVHED